jgi:hypothetical protein
MAEERKEEALFKRIEALNLRLEYDAGFLIVARSASPAQQRDGDDAEIEQAFIEQMGNNLKKLSILAVGKALGARGKDFLGAQVFIPSIRNFGRLQSVGEDGVATVSYRRESFKNPEVAVDVIHSGPGTDLLLILNDDGPAPATKTSFTWIADERLRGLFERAAEAGLRLEHDSGFTLVKRRAVDGVELGVVEGMVRDKLGPKLREIYALTAARARGERGSHFVGKRVLVPEFFNSFGTIASSDGDGKVTVTYRDKHMGSQYTCWCKGDALLIVPDEDAAKATSAVRDSEESGWRKLVRRAFGG